MSHELLAKNLVEQNRESGEEFLDYGFAQQNPSFWWVLFTWIFFLLLIKQFVVVVTNKRIFLLRLDSLTQKPKEFLFYPLAVVKVIRLKNKLLGKEITFELQGEKRVLWFPRFRKQLKDETVGLFEKNF